MGGGLLAFAVGSDDQYPDMSAKFRSKDCKLLRTLLKGCHADASPHRGTSQWCKVASAPPGVHPLMIEQQLQQHVDTRGLEWPAAHKCRLQERINDTCNDQRQSAWGHKYTVFADDQVTCAYSLDDVLQNDPAPPSSSQSRTGTVSIRPRAASSSVRGTTAAAA